MPHKYEAARPETCIHVFTLVINMMILKLLLAANASNFTSPDITNFTGNFAQISNASLKKTGTAGPLPLPRILNAVMATPSDLLIILIKYNYPALFALMLLDSSGLPPPSELIMPPAGFLARLGYLNFGLIFIVLMLANAIGASIDYYIGYHFGELFIRRHIRVLRIKPADLDSFEAWFRSRGRLAVFFGRLLPVVRIIISFPAGVAKMPYDTFILFTLMGAAIYNYLLMLFGYLLISENLGLVFVAVLGAIPVVFYIVHRLMMQRMPHDRYTRVHSQISRKLK